MGAAYCTKQRTADTTLGRDLERALGVLCKLPKEYSLQRVSLGRLAITLGPLGDPLGSLGSPSGALGGPPGAPWVPLGASWGVLGADDLSKRPKVTQMAPT